MKATFDEKYEYIENDPIRSGAYGHIYRIRDKKLKTQYVLKKLRMKDQKYGATLDDINYRKKDTSSNTRSKDIPISNNELFDNI